MDEPKPDRHMLPLRELGRALVKHFGFTEGLWDVTVEFKMGAGSFGPSQTELMPSAFVGVSQVGITRVTQPGPYSIDATAESDLGAFREAAAAPPRI